MFRTQEYELAEVHFRIKYF